MSRVLVMETTVLSDSGKYSFEIEPKLYEYMRRLCDEFPDPSHDLLHVKRVVSTAKKLAREENGNLDVIVPAAYLHDCVWISKTDSRRSQASKISADRAIELLSAWHYPTQMLSAIHHSIHAHSFSAGIRAETLEAKIVQDADRLDAIGAIGIFRCLAFSGLSLRPFYQEADPFCREREPNDSLSALDHFYTKLIKLPETLHTKTGKNEGLRRLTVMKNFLDALAQEILS